MAELSDATDIREAVREKYAAAARSAAAGDAVRARAGEAGAGCCGPGPDGCGPSGGASVFGSALYDDATGSGVPESALSASLGCGVPTAVADLHEGETVLDLGSGAGADVLISARRVGPTGRAIGLDMTDEMLELARANAKTAGVRNVEFLKGYLEELPLAEETVDVIISNCVINLSGDKGRVLREAGRVLRPGGRLAVSDVIADPDLDARTRTDVSAWTGCIAGALTEPEFRAALVDAGFEAIEIHETHRVHEHAAAAIIRARKPSRVSAPTCGLDRGGLAAQLARYRVLAHHVADVKHEEDRLVVQFSGAPPRELIERTLEVERGCCPFFGIEYDSVARRLTMTLDDADRRPALDAIARALAARDPRLS